MFGLTFLTPSGHAFVTLSSKAAFKAATSGSPSDLFMSELTQPGGGYTSPEKDKLPNEGKKFILLPIIGDFVRY